MSKPWFERYPRIYDREIQAYSSLDIAYEINEVAKDNGILEIKFCIEPNNVHFSEANLQDSLELVGVYPENYPFFRPQVFALNLTLHRHQNPVDKNLCLLGRSSIEWDSTSTLPTLLVQQLPDLLIKGIREDLEIVQNDPAEQAEPISEYYSLPDAPILFDPHIFEEEDLAQNDFNLIATIKVGIATGNEFPRRMAVLQTTINSTGVLSSCPIEYIQKTFKIPIRGQVYRIAEAPPVDPKDCSVWLQKKISVNNGTFRNFKNSSEVSNNFTIVGITGLSFPEEKQKGVWGFGWLFLVEFVVKNYDPATRTMKKTKGAYYARGTDIAPLSKSVRAPKLAPLIGQKVSIAGLGALGSFVAIELARSGVTSLALLDNDSVEAPTTIRWPLGLSAVGENKGKILKEFLNDNYPLQNVEVFPLLIGGCRTPEQAKINNQKPEGDQIDLFVAGSSLIIDATTEFGVHHYLSRVARDNGIPYISLHATPGVYGGSVMKQLARSGGCWSCFTHMENDKAILTLNDDSENGTIQPPGCGDLTFTGASVDLQQISQMAARLAISTLCEGTPDGYPSVEWQIARVNLFDENGGFIVPEWKTYDLPIHPNCHYCNDK